MSAPCPPEAPSYYTFILHCIAIVSAPINMLALYLVLYKSPGMSKYKYGICYLQLASFLTELQQSIVCPGYYFFPLLAGFNTAEFFGTFLRGHISMTMWTFFLASEVPAITWCFIYRHDCAVKLTTSERRRHVIKNSMFFISQVFPFFTSFSLYMSEISYEEAFVFLNNKYPHCTFWLQAKTFSIYDWNTNKWIAICGLGALGFVCVFTVFGVALGAHTMYLLHQLRSLMSPQTYRMHRTALISLTLQVIIPSVLLILPLHICLYVVVQELVEYQQLATNSTILIACHSLGSSLVMICANPRYRKLIKGFLCDRFMQKRSEPISMVERSSRRSTVGLSDKRRRTIY